MQKHYYPTLYYNILYYSCTIAITILYYTILSYPILYYPILHCTILPYPILPYPALSYPTLPYPTLPYPTLYDTLLHRAFTSILRMGGLPSGLSWHGMVRHEMAWRCKYYPILPYTMLHQIFILLYAIYIFIR